MPTVTDGFSRAETPAETGPGFSSHRQVTGPDRLVELLALREQLDVEIERERAALRRLQALQARAAHALTPRSWEDQVLGEVARAYVVDVAELTGRSRDAHVTEARHVAAWILRQAGWSLPAIGELLGRDHTAILHGVRRVDGADDLRAIATDLQAAVRPVDARRVRAAA